MKTKLILASASLLLISSTSFAAPSDEIVITAKGGQTLAEVLPTSHVFNLDDIELAQAKDIPALLDSLTGVSVRASGGRGSVTSVFVRGVANSQIIVLIDGVRVGSATLGAAALNNYPVEAIERIEVIKGPLSGIYGADAVGGVIQLFTKKGGDGLGSATATIGSDSLLEYGVSFNGGNNKNSFFISAHAEETDGFDSTSILTDGNGDDDAFEEAAFSFGGKATLSDRTVAQLSVLYTDNSVEFDNTFGADVGNTTDTKTLSSALNVTTEFSDTLSWSNTLGINKDEADTISSFPSSFETSRDSLGTEFTIGLAAKTVLTLGADYYQEEITSNNDYAELERDNTGVFAQIQTQTGAFGLVGSLRYDDNSAYDDNTNGSVAINYDFNEATRVVLSYGTAFVAPSFNFLYFPFFGNPDLLPEESKSVELSLLGNNNGINWRISAYKTDVENLFSFDPNTFLAANVGEAKLKGIEFEVNANIADWTLSANLDFLSAEDKTTGIELDDRAEQTLRLTATREFGALALRLDMKSERGRFDRVGTELSSYGLLEVGGSYQFNEKLSLLAKVENVFDKDYTVNLINATERYNTEGRQAKLTVRYQF